jgi:UDP:flavonoid glycosyltransferase YjiC (YdhE family)
MPLSFLLAAWGNPGTLNPLLTAARRLRREGHRVRFIGDADHREEMSKGGFDHVAWRRPTPLSPPDTSIEEPVWAEIRALIGQLMIGSAIDFAADTMDG